MLVFSRKWPRRAFLTGAGSALASVRVTAAEGVTPSVRLTAIEARIGGRLGVAALDTGSGARLSHRADERFAMCSTFKMSLVAMVLSRVDRGEVALGRRITYRPADLLDYAPVTRAHLAEGSMTVNDLAAAAVELSDNTAANLLLKLIGGPAALTAWLRALGDPITRLDRNEPTLNTNLPGDPRDTTAPNAMVATMRKILIGNLLSPASRERLLDWMKASTPGLHRLRAGVPPNWAAGDKTGTGTNGAINDLAIFWRPERAPILIACYLDGSKRPQSDLDAAHVEVGRVVAEAFG